MKYKFVPFVPKYPVGTRLSISCQGCPAVVHTIFREDQDGNIGEYPDPPNALDGWQGHGRSLKTMRWFCRECRYLRIMGW